MPLKKLLATLCGLLAASALFSIMALTLVDVLGRKLLDHSLPGSLEVTELLMVVVIFAGLPLVSLQGEHVVFDSLDGLLPSALRRLQHAVVDLLCAAALLGIGWLMWVKAGQLGDYGETTAQLKMSLAPFVRVMSLLCTLTGAVHVLLMFRPLGSRAAGGA